ncbi:MAG: NAD(P)H-hydrate dehydratase [Clostridiales bacterium]|nr:NAD(P)H-hydrate dehydratase [Clostridiales bacterium]
MRVLTAKQIKKVEETAFKGECTEASLMLSAGTTCYKRIVKIFKAETLSNSNIAVICGNGKNAGDGFVIASLLKNSGANAFIVLADKEPKIAEPVKYFNMAKKNGVKCINFTDNCLESNVNIIVDCIFGIGFHGEPRTPFDRVFEAVNKSSAAVVSIDTPSGTDATNGSVVSAVKADYTIAISTLKYAHILPPANSYCGKIFTVDIGIPESCYDDEITYAHTLTQPQIKKLFTARDKNSNKGTFGHQLNICGSYSMPGAAVICAKAGLRSGAGLVKCAFPKSIYPVLTSHMSQPLFKPLCENEDKTISVGAINDIFDELKWASSVVIGCGLGNNDDTQVITDQVIKTSEVPIILDADGINAVAPFIDIIKDKKAPIVITPHPGEMARLIGESADYVQENRLQVAKAFAQENDVILVLKGADTIVTDGSEVFFNTNGNPGMAMGGTGDMLSGMISSFIAQGLSPFDAAKAGVFIHGLTGDICASELSQRGMTIDDMLSLLGAVMSEFED